MFNTAPRPAFAIGLVLGLAALPVFGDEPRRSGNRAPSALCGIYPEALSHDTVRALPSPRTVVTPSANALAIASHFDLGGYIFKDGVSFLHNDGGAAYRNTALGLDALVSTTPGQPSYFYGVDNTALGFAALTNNTEGYGNTASGAFALYANTTGGENTASGAFALRYNTTGDSNTASGSLALYFNTTGYGNTALGRAAGIDNINGSNSIWIASRGADESNTLRIGAGTGTGYFQQNRAFIAGIRNATLSGMMEQTVCVDDADQVGPCSISSARFKRDIRAMGEASAGIEDLRPVVFKYRPEVKNDAEAEHFGLIAEEVAKIYPGLVTTDAEGRPFSVRYDLLTPLLLNEMQAQQRQIATLASRNAELEATQRDLVARLRKLEALAAGDP